MVCLLFVSWVSDSIGTCQQALSQGQSCTGMSISHLSRPSWKPAKQIVEVSIAS